MALGVQLNAQVLVTGAITGLTYGGLALGIVLLYRSSRVINFAYGEMGAFGAALLSVLVVNEGWSYWEAIPVVLVAGGLMGAVIELVVVRRLFESPRVILFVATLGVAQLVLLGILLLPELDHFARYPTPVDTTIEIGDVLLRGEHLAVLVGVPLLALVLALFLNRTQLGVNLRAAAANPDAARLAGVNVRATSTIVWTIAGVVAVITGVLVAPLRSTTAVVTVALGPSLLLRSLAAALIGGMRSFSLAVVGGLGIGVVEAVLLYNNPTNPGLVDIVLLGVVLVAVVLRSGRRGSGERASWSFAPRVRQIPDQLRQIWWVRHLAAIGSLTALGLAILAPVVLGEASRQFQLSRVLLFAAVAVSIAILTGWTGQLSLGQFSFVGIGALSTAALVRAGWAFPFAVAAGCVFSVIAAVVIGLPALRLRGLFLAVTTLAFAVAAETYLFTRPVFLGDSSVVFLPRPTVLGVDFTGQRTYYYLCLGLLAVVLVLAGRLRRSGVGRSFLAVRDNEDGAAAFTVSPTRTKLQAFALGGGIAGFAGGMLAGLLVQFGPDSFRPEASIQVVAIAVIGGLGSLPGAVLGALWVIGLPALLGTSTEVTLLTSGAGLLLLLLYFPGGLVQILEAARDGLLRLARPVSTAPTAASPARVPTASARTEPAGGRVAPSPALSVEGLTVRYGARTVIEQLDFELATHAVVGLIGANGAGKTTLMQAIGGFIPSTGHVELLGHDVSSASAATRARQGLGRTFQGAELFADLTVRDTLRLALEARGRSSLTGTLLALPGARRAERAKRAEADELLDFVGLGRYAEAFVGDLSTGTRRIVELGCLLALDARVLCLDEPTAGIAQRETEALAPLIESIRAELGATMLVIEHDMPFIMGISDRVCCLEAGRIIADGTPDEVRSDPLVISSYLGTDDRAIDRSDH
jgi:ABC-type branched-subunit amino acid transport system permease subunit/ABC-type branched-subunit amino acid transport system ATPase component